MNYASSYAECLPPNAPSDEQVAFDAAARDNAIAEIAGWSNNKAVTQWLTADPAAFAAIRCVLSAADPDERAGYAAGMREQFATYFENTGSIGYLINHQRHFG